MPAAIKQTEALTPAPVTMRTSSATFPVPPTMPRRSACRCRKSRSGCRPNSTARLWQAHRPWRRDQNPAVRADTGMAIADCAGQGGRIAGLHRQLFPPGEQEIVARAVGFRKRDHHLFAMVDFDHRRSFHHDLPPQGVTGFLQRAIALSLPKMPTPTRRIPIGEQRSGRAMAASNAAPLPSCKPHATECPPRAERRSGLRTEK